MVIRLFILLGILPVLFSSCDSDPYGSHWYGNESSTIGRYLEENQQEYSKFYQLLDKGKLLGTLGGYNPYGAGYTLFLPTNDAIDNFIQQNQQYENFDELLQDTSFIYKLTRFHTVNKKVRTDEFPDGALTDKTLTGDRLVTGFYTEGDDMIIRINNVAPVIESNLDMTNGYVNVISKVLQPVEISGYDWLQQHDDYSILAQAMEYCRIRNRLWFDKYTILAEHDSIYQRNGIMSLEDLIDSVAPSGASSSTKTNSLFEFTAYHILMGDFYLNDLYWGNNGYWTMANKPITIDVGLNLRINPGVETYGISISESGDTTVIDYASPVWENSNILTQTGPVHSISEILYNEPFP